MADQRLTITLERRKQAIVVALHGDLDFGTVPQLQGVLELPPGEEQLVLDLSGVANMDSSGLAAVIFAEATAREARRRVAIVEGPATIQQPFERAGLASRLPFVPSLDAALATH